MAIKGHNYYAVTVIIVCICCISYYTLYSRYYDHIGFYGLLQTNLSTSLNPYGRQKLKSTLHLPTHTSIASKPIYFSQQVITSTSWTISKSSATSTPQTATQSIFNSSTIKSVKKFYKTHPTTLVTTSNKFNGSKVILMWTRYYKEPQWKLENDFTRILPMGKSYFKSYCPQYDCYLTINKTLYNDSDAIVFHERNIYFRQDKIMPSYQFPWQRWVYYNIESPFYCRSFEKYPYQKDHAIYNWSMTYLQTSHVDASYGYIVKRIKPTRTWMYTWSIDYHGSKKRDIAWLVSHCKMERTQFVKALAKHIPVDIYGECGTHKCKHKSNFDCWKYEMTPYKFYLAFENSVCTDYVTEKFWYPLRFGVIPVVLGGGQYRQIAPPHSYIDVNDFKNIPALASYLHQVANNKTLYNSYMKWRQHWEIVIPRHWCNLCSALHRYNSSSRDTYRTYNDDFGEHGEAKNCKVYPTPKN